MKKNPGAPRLKGGFVQMIIMEVVHLSQICLAKMLHSHPIDSLYTVESGKDTVPVVEHIFGQKMRDSGKYFACFCLSFQLITLVHVLVSSYGRQTAKGGGGSIRKAFVLDESCKTVLSRCICPSSFKTKQF